MGLLSTGTRRRRITPARKAFRQYIKTKGHIGQDFMVKTYPQMLKDLAPLLTPGEHRLYPEHLARWLTEDFPKVRGTKHTQHARRHNAAQLSEP